MPYGLIYFSEFNTISAQPLNYRLNIYKKDYDGATSEITLTANACIQEWQDDNPMEPIKGCTLNVGILNDGTISLEDFYSESDDEFYLEFIRVDTDQCLFRGYVLQDDCQEIVVEYSHEIKIVATDNLGTLKSVKLNDAAQVWGVPTTLTALDIKGSIIGGSFTSNDSRIGTLKAGQQFKIENTTTYNGTYTCTFIEYNSFYGQYVIYTNPEFDGNFGDPLESADISYNAPLDIFGYVSLLTLVRLCLKSTNIDCGLKVISQLYVDNGATLRWLDSTIIKGSTFENNDSWDDCYIVLEKIMKRFNASCFQSKGEWYIVRWGEYFNRKQADTNPPFSLIGYNYDNNFEYVSEYYNNDLFSIEPNDIATGLIKSIIRPYKFVNETFNYNPIASLIANTDLQELGDLRTTYVSGANTIYEYEPLFWTKQAGSDSYIKIYKENNKKEVLREIAIDWTFGNILTPLKSSSCEINAGSKIEISIDFIYANANYVIINRIVPFVIVYDDGVNQYTLRENGQFSNGPLPSLADPNQAQPTQYCYFYADANYNANEYNTFTRTAVVPGDGKIYFYLPYFNDNSGTMNFKNIKFGAVGVYLQSETVIGQTHTQTQTPTIKNSLSNDIYIDNSPSGIIEGTLFTDQVVNGIQQLANEWVVKCGNLVTKPMTLTALIGIGENDGFIYEGCPLDIAVDDYITLSDFTPGEPPIYTWDMEYRVTGLDTYNGNNIFYVNSPILSAGTHTGTVTYIATDKIFDSLGEYTVKEQLFNFRKPWYKYNGTLLKINIDERMITNLSSFYFNDEAYNNSNIMLFGSLSIDYRNEAIDFTLWAMFEQLVDPWCDFSNFEDSTIYNFTYIYDIKQ